VVLPELIKVVDAWPRLSTLNLFWLMPLAVCEIGSFICAMSLLRLVLRTKQWFPVVTAGMTGNAVTNVVPGGDAAGASYQFQMLSAAGIGADQAAGGLVASSILGTAGLFILPIFALPALLGGEAVSAGLKYAAILGSIGFVAITVIGTVLLVSDGLLLRLGRVVQWILTHVPGRRQRTENLPTRLIAERDLVRDDLGRNWWRALLLIAGRVGLDYLALLAALRAAGASPNPSLVLLAYAATAVVALVPLTPGGLGIVEASLSGLLVLANVPASRAVLAALAFRVATYWIPTLVSGGCYIAFRRRYGPIHVDDKSSRHEPASE